MKSRLPPLHSQVANAAPPSSAGRGAHPPNDSPRQQAQSQRIVALQAPLQRYSSEGAHRVSNARLMAVGTADETKVFFGTPGLIAKSNAVLEGMNSKVKLEVGADAPAELRGMKAAQPVPRDPDRPNLFDVNECIDVADRITNSAQTHAIYQPAGGDKHLQPQSAYSLSYINKVIEVLSSQVDVDPQQLVAVQEEMRRIEESPDSEPQRYHFRIGGTEVDTDVPKDASEAIKPLVGDVNLRIALLNRVLKSDGVFAARQVQQDLAEDLAVLLDTIQLNPDAVRSDDAIDSWRDLLADMISGRAAMERAARSQEYASLDANDADRRAAQLGVNAHARPDVGEAYAILSTRERHADERDKWSFHFAAVIARDGDDSVTLENFNRMKGAEGNASWYFDMQGPRDQSFHAKHQHSVANALTLRMGAAATPELKQRFAERIGARLLDESLQGRIDAAVTAAELAAIYAEALDER